MHARTSVGVQQCLCACSVCTEARRRTLHDMFRKTNRSTTSEAPNWDRSSGVKRQAGTGLAGPSDTKAFVITEVVWYYRCMSIAQAPFLEYLKPDNLNASIEETLGAK